MDWERCAHRLVCNESCAAGSFSGYGDDCAGIHSLDVTAFRTCDADRIGESLRRRIRDYRYRDSTLATPAGHHLGHGVAAYTGGSQFLAGDMRI